MNQAEIRTVESIADEAREYVKGRFVPERYDDFDTFDREFFNDRDFFEFLADALSGVAEEEMQNALDELKGVVGGFGHYDNVMIDIYRRKHGGNNPEPGNYPIFSVVKDSEFQIKLILALAARLKYANEYGSEAFGSAPSGEPGALAAGVSTAVERTTKRT